MHLPALSPIFVSGKPVIVESNGEVKLDGTGATDDPNERAHWWAVYVGGRRVATGPTIWDALHAAIEAELRAALDTDNLPF